MSYTRSHTKPHESFDIGYVLWEDANSMSGGATHTPTHTSIPLLTAGVITQNDAAGVTVCMDFSAEGSFREVRFIPRVNVKDVRVLMKNAVSRAPQWASFPEPQQPPTKRTKRRKK